jgi:hypothetical protein
MACNTYYVTHLLQVPHLPTGPYKPPSIHLVVSLLTRPRKKMHLNCSMHCHQQRIDVAALCLYLCESPANSLVDNNILT